VTSQHLLRAIPTDDRAWLLAAISDALDGGSPVLPVPAESDQEVIDAILEQPIPDGTALVIQTSGSSGVPKAVALSAAALKASAAATHEALGGAGGWLVTLPTHLISGMQMLVRSAISGVDPVFVDGPFDPEQLLQSAEGMHAGRRYVSLVPVQFARLLDVAQDDEEAAEVLRSFDAMLVGGQHVPLELRQRAHDLGVALKRSYGMTETAGGCVYDGVEIGDTRVRIRQGEVQLAGSALALGYLGDPALTAKHFVEETNRSGEQVRWYRTGDAGELLGGMLTVTGRLDRVFVSGGVNVSLDEIERVMREFPGWASAIALATDHPDWGQRPVLVVETQGAATSAECTPFDRVQEVIRERLGPAATPDWVTETDEIPRLPGGKPDLPAVEEWFETQTSQHNAVADPEPQQHSESQEAQ
jgi:O-succinylbenzoic acid--CoA ligase